MTVLVIHNQPPDKPDLSLAVEKCNYTCFEVEGLREAYKLLNEQNSAIHVIMVNYSHLMENPNFLRRLSSDENMKDIPLILGLEGRDPADIKPFKHSSSYAWLEPPFSEQALNTTIFKAENEFSQRQVLRREIQTRASLIGTVTRGTFRIKTFDQAEALTTMLSLACPEPDRVALGLFELIANAIEHGNLEINSEKKHQLLDTHLHRQEIKNRLAMPEYRDRYVEVTFEREANLVSFKIEDQGPGFDFEQFLNVDLSTNHSYQGRGIALAQATSFDCMEYIGTGNKVLAISKFKAP